ncbi:UNVERIFIED_CONTAM: hypothetical protein Sindi_1838300 [Sesamum indicum]
METLQLSSEDSLLTHCRQQLLPATDSPAAYDFPTDMAFLSFKQGSAPFSSIGSNKPDPDPSAFEDPDNCGRPIVDAGQQDGGTWLANSALLRLIYRPEMPSLKSLLSTWRSFSEIAEFELDQLAPSVGKSENYYHGRFIEEKRRRGGASRKGGTTIQLTKEEQQRMIEEAMRNAIVEYERRTATPVAKETARRQLFENTKPQRESRVHGGQSAEPRSRSHQMRGPTVMLGQREENP